MVNSYHWSMLIASCVSGVCNRAAQCHDAVERLARFDHAMLGQRFWGNHEQSHLQDYHEGASRPDAVGISVYCRDQRREGEADQTHDHGRRADVNVSSAEYLVPDVTLMRSDGTRISLPSEINDGRPVILNFIYTTCTDICPVMSQIMMLLQNRLGPVAETVHMVSISIDPEQDTPARLQAYAKKFSAGPHWQHYTGTVAASIAAQKAFNVYRGDKMRHDPLTFMRVSPGKPWLRIEGFASDADLAGQYERLAGRSRVGG